jgi:predicted FMN-binding regulatory protein PaiB
MMHIDMGDPERADEFDVSVEEDIPEETVVISETEESDNVGDVSVEINVEELVAEIEASQNQDAHRKKEIRRRLEELEEQKLAAKELDDTFNMELGGDE